MKKLAKVFCVIVSMYFIVVLAVVSYIMGYLKARTQCDGETEIFTDECCGDDDDFVSESQV